MFFYTVYFSYKSNGYICVLLINMNSTGIPVRTRLINRKNSSSLPVLTQKELAHWSKQHLSHMGEEDEEELKQPSCRNMAHHFRTDLLILSSQNNYAESHHQRSSHRNHDLTLRFLGSKVQSSKTVGSFQISNTQLLCKNTGFVLGWREFQAHFYIPSSSVFLTVTSSQHRAISVAQLWIFYQLERASRSAYDPLL